MLLRRALAIPLFALSVLLLSAPAYAQSCTGQARPIRPTCSSEAKLSCVCGAGSCRWEWACEQSRTTAAPSTSGIDPSIPLRINTPKQPDLLETFRTLQDIRNAQAENQRIEAEIERNRRKIAENEKHGRGESAATATPPETPQPQQVNGRPLEVSVQAWSERNKTLGNVNGRFWQSLTASSKIDFLIGFEEGFNTAAPSGIPWTLREIVGDEKAAAAEQALRDSRDLAWYFPKGMTYGELLKGVDRFYDIPENIRLTIQDALEIFTRRANGATQVEIDEVSALRRRSLRDVEEKMGKQKK